MAKFKFTLAPLKVMRNHKLLMAKKEAALVEQEFDVLCTQLREAKGNRSQLLDDINASVNKIDVVKVFSELVETQTVKIRNLETQIAAKEPELERHRRWVAELAKELKIIEKIEEKQLKAFEQEQKLREKRQSDRWVSERFAHKMSQAEAVNIKERYE